MQHTHRREMFILRAGFFFVLLGLAGLFFSVVGMLELSREEGDRIAGIGFVFFGSLFVIIGLRTVGLYLSHGKQAIRGFLYSTDSAKGGVRQRISTPVSRVVLTLIGMVAALTLVVSGISYVGGAFLDVQVLGLLAFIVLLFILPKAFNTSLLGENYRAMRAHIAEERKNAEASKPTYGEAKGSFLIPIKKVMTKGPEAVLDSTGEVRYHAHRESVRGTRFVTLEPAQGDMPRLTLIKSVGGMAVEITDDDQERVANIIMQPGRQEEVTLKEGQIDVWRKRVFSRQIRLSQGKNVLLSTSPGKINGKRGIVVEHYDGDETLLIAVAYGLLFGMLL